MNTQREEKKSLNDNHVQFPEPGFYYSYKHKPGDAFNIYAYFFTGFASNKDAPPERRKTIDYYPLDPEAPVFKMGRGHDWRPLREFYEPVEVNGEYVPRYTLITDKLLIAKLSAQKAVMYPFLSM